MSSSKYVPPKRHIEAFTCPHCGAFAHQRWHDVYDSTRNYFPDYVLAVCTHCKRATAWRLDEMIYPAGAAGEVANQDLPSDIAAIYEEARLIARTSPRGAAALLRLSIQLLCKSLGEPGGNINDDIASLVKKGLPAGVQKALDAVRVIGNEAVHPGTIDFDDDSGAAASLFGLVNFIAEKMISEPKEIERIYGELPTVKRDAIAKRDGTAGGQGG